MSKMDPVVHFEMPAEDKKRMSEFYSKVFGWQTKMMGPEMNEYVVVMTSESADGEMGPPKTPGMINGGFYQKGDDEWTRQPSFVIAVDDLKASIEKIKAAGGRMKSDPMPIPGVGMFASFIDTEGNHVSVMQPDKKM